MRVKRGVTSRARHNSIRKATKGFTRPNRRSIKLGRQAIIKSLQHAYRDRRNKKGVFRSLWNARIGAAAVQNGTSYSVFMGKLAKTGITLNRKMLSEVAVYHPEAFTAIIKEAK
jgi:large subunit ribosomal protein L20